MTVTEQSLFDSDTIQLAWERFNARYPEVLSRIAEIVAKAKDRGETRYSMKLAFELVRGDVPRDGNPVALNNSWTAPAVRTLSAVRPDLAPMFRTRARKCVSLGVGTDR